MRKVHLKTKIMITFVLVTLLSTLISCMFIISNTLQNQKVQIKERITHVAKIVSDDTRVKDALVEQKPVKNSQLDKNIKKLQKELGVDFIVVLDNSLIRYTHPNKASIGNKFSDPKDATQSLSGRRHYSTKKGVMGIGYRVFNPIYNDSGKQIGIVCVGLTLTTVNTSIFTALIPILKSFTISLFVSLVTAIILSFYIRKELLDMDPDEISRRVTELNAITESMSEGIIAINLDNKIVEVNRVAKGFFPQVNIGDTIDSDLFENAFSDNDLGRDKLGVINSKEFYISTSILISENKKIGRIALFRDISEYIKLENQLEGTNEYIEALRAQQHEFLNKLHAVYGLIELNKYDEAKKFISTTQSTFHKEFGSVNSQIQMPAVAGFIIGKMKEATEKGIDLQLSPESKINRTLNSGELSSDLIKVLGNLIDNSFDSLIEVQSTKSIIVSINYDSESNFVIIEVEDTGSGIDSEDKGKILKTRFSTKGKDRGYGLNIVNQIILKHNGFIDFIDNSPQGTITYIELPL